MKKLVTLIVAAMAISSSPAGAQSVQISEDGQYRVAIPYGDLNLASKAGARTLNGRIKAAANVVCGTGQHPIDLIGAREVQSCRSTLMTVARPQVELALRDRGSGSIALASAR